MSAWAKTLEIRSSPHIGSGHGVDSIMFNVVLALLPVTAYAVWHFGLAALLNLSVAVISCGATEHVLCRLTGRKSTLGDWSVIVTGLLYGLTLPPGLALWMVAVVAWWPWGSASFSSVDWATTPSIPLWSDAPSCRPHFRCP